MNYKSVFYAIAVVLVTPSISIAGDNAAFIDPAAGKCCMYNDAGELVYTTDTRIVMTRDPLTETTHLKCNFETTPTLSGGSWTEEGFLCATFNPDVGIMFTNDTHVRQTPKGKMSMTCHFEVDG